MQPASHTRATSASHTPGRKRGAHTRTLQEKGCQGLHETSDVWVVEHGTHSGQDDCEDTGTQCVSTARTGGGGSRALRQGGRHRNSGDTRNSPARSTEHTPASAAGAEHDTSTPGAPCTAGHLAPPQGHGSPATHPRERGQHHDTHGQHITTARGNAGQANQILRAKPPRTRQCPRPVEEHAQQLGEEGGQARPAGAAGMHEPPAHGGKRQGRQARQRFRTYTPARCSETASTARRQPHTTATRAADERAARAGLASTARERQRTDGSRACHGPDPAADAAGPARRRPATTARRHDGDRRKQQADKPDRAQACGGRQADGAPGGAHVTHGRAQRTARTGSARDSGIGGQHTAPAPPRDRPAPRSALTPAVDASAQARQTWAAASRQTSPGRARRAPRQSWLRQQTNR